MKGKPSLDEFRTGGGDVPPQQPPPSAAIVPPAAPAVQAPAAQAPPPPSPVPAPPPAVATASADIESRSRENKTIRLRKSFVKRLKSDAFHRTNAEGRRVTESDIIDEALDIYFRTHPPA